MEIEKCDKKFRFWETIYHSKERITIPFKVKTMNEKEQIDEYYEEMKTYILNWDAPWLLGMNTMTDWQVKLYMRNDKLLEINTYKEDKPIKLFLTMPSTHMNYP